METITVLETSVATMMSQLKARRNTPKEHFKLKLNPDDLAMLLTEAYRQEVESRKKVFAEDESTSSLIRRVSLSLTDAERSKFGLMLVGFTGNGKSTMLRAMTSVIDICAKNGATSMAKGLSIYDANAVLRIAEKNTEWSDFMSQSLLAIDDFGKEAVEVTSYGNATSPMIELMEYRYQHQLYTVLSSNLRPEDVRQRYGRRIADRFNEMFDVIPVKGETYRR